MSGVMQSVTAQRERHPIDATLAARLASIVGERRVLYRPAELLAYSSDGLPGYFKQPSIAVFPGKPNSTHLESGDTCGR